MQRLQLQVRILDDQNPHHLPQVVRLVGVVESQLRVGLHGEHLVLQLHDFLHGECVYLWSIIVVIILLLDGRLLLLLLLAIVREAKRRLVCSIFRLAVNDGFIQIIKHLQNLLLVFCDEGHVVCVTISISEEQVLACLDRLALGVEICFPHLVQQGAHGLQVLPC